MICFFSNRFICKYFWFFRSWRRLRAGCEHYSVPYRALHSSGHKDRLQWTLKPSCAGVCVCNVGNVGNSAWRRAFFFIDVVSAVVIFQCLLSPLESNIRLVFDIWGDFPLLFLFTINTCSLFCSSCCCCLRLHGVVVNIVTRVEQHKFYIYL